MVVMLNFIKRKVKLIGCSMFRSLHPNPSSVFQFPKVNPLYLI